MSFYALLAILYTLSSRTALYYSVDEIYFRSCSHLWKLELLSVHYTAGQYCRTQGDEGSKDTPTRSLLAPIIPLMDQRVSEPPFPPLICELRPMDSDTIRKHSARKAKWHIDIGTSTHQAGTVWATVYPMWILE
jgi:hypothetical protein